MLNPDAIPPIKPQIKGLEGTLGKYKPSSIPRSDKNFSRMVDRKKSSDDDDDVPRDQNDIDENNKDDSSLSIFDLSAKKPPKDLKDTLESYRLKNQDIEIPSNPQELDTEMAEAETPPSDTVDTTKLAMQETANPKIDPRYVNPNIKNDDHFPVEAESPHSLSEDKGESSSKTGKRLSRLDGQERNDWASLQASPFAPIESRYSINDKAQMTEQTRSMQDIVNQLVESMRTMKSEGKQETIITLQYPPILKGTDIHLAAFDVDKTRFDIAFTNLTIQGKAFLDQQLQKDPLTLALEQRGFVVQTLITTTEKNIPSTQPTPQEFTRQNDKEQQQQQDQREQRRKPFQEDVEIG